MKPKPIQVTHLTTSISREAGGLFESVRHLSQETSRNGIDIRILSVDDPHTATDVVRWRPLPVETFPLIGPKRLGWAPGISRHLERSQADILHLHGVWQYTTLAVLRWARRTRRPYVVSPHGMLEPWALQHNRYRKAVANWLFQNACLQGASCLRATAVSEVESIRLAGLVNPVALIANGVPFPEILPARQPRSPGQRKRALFVSRIHPKKGLLNLVGAWARLRAHPASRAVADQWEVALVGPDENGHLGEVMAAVRAAGLEERIIYLGEIWEEAAKLACYVNADLFVLPTFSENFGLVIAEALTCGVPVITTRAAPWAELETCQCGWWIETGEAPLLAALQTALATPDEVLQAMGARGRALVERQYSWKKPGREMAEVYQWLLGRGPRPECVV